MMMMRLEIFFFSFVATTIKPPAAHSQIFESFACSRVEWGAKQELRLLYT